jgi:AraC-like DNA-binding protein
MTATLRAVQHDSDLGRWEYVFGAPRTGLAAYVNHYQGYVEQHSGFERRREFPRPNSSIIFNVGAPLRISNPTTGETVDEARSFIAGISDYYVTTESLGTSAGIEVNFTPLGARIFLGVPTDGFADRVCALADVIGLEADLLTERLASTDSWQLRFDLIDDYVARRFAIADMPARQIEGAFGALWHSGGLRSVASLAHDAGWSEKHLVARFREQVGMAPKTMGRIIRFDHALNLLQKPSAATLSDVVFEAGYYDQSHMNRDFRQFTGGSPSEFLKLQLPDGAGLRDSR